MEREGLSRMLKFLQQMHSVVKTLVTDCHRQIQKWIKERHPEINHYYDTWHVVKGTLYTCTLQTYSIHVFVTFVYCRLEQKLQVYVLGRQKDCGLVVQWQRSILNRLY